SLSFNTKNKQACVSSVSRVHFCIKIGFAEFSRDQQFSFFYILEKHFRMNRLHPR
ncbi:hypothetical protein Leryth_000452, partial [Lithospermum erythrorhizon]